MGILILGGLKGCLMKLVDPVFGDNGSVALMCVILAKIPQ